MEIQYTITDRVSILRDSPRDIDFHIRSDDYFLHVATLVGTMEEALSEEPSGQTEAERQRARELRNDLRYVQANYQIVPRPLADVQIVRPSGNLLGH